MESIVSILSHALQTITAGKGLGGPQRGPAPLRAGEGNCRVGFRESGSQNELDTAHKGTEPVSSRASQSLGCLAEVS